MSGKPGLTYEPVTAARWDDLANLFGPRGACTGCWCMHWRQTSREFREKKGARNRAALKRLIGRGVVPGILAYDGDRPIGWCSLGPREEFVRLATARSLKPVDDRPTWSIVCLFVEKGYRQSGIATALVKAAAKYAKECGATLIEGYPYDFRHLDKPQPPPFVYTGLYQCFEKAGFTEVARPSKTRAIMRKKL